MRARMNLCEHCPYNVLLVQLGTVCLVNTVWKKKKKSFSLENLQVKIFLTDGER